MKPILFLLFLHAVNLLPAQDTSFYDAGWNKLETRLNAVFYEILTRDVPDSGHRLWKTYYASGKLRSERVYAAQLPDGCHRVWFENGQLQKEINYKKGQLHGALLTYWENGHPKRQDFYQHDSLTSGKCTDREGNLLPYFAYEKLPEFPGGMEKLRSYLARELKYPPNARRQEIEGQVKVSFVVNKDGSIDHIRIQKSVSPELDAEAIRVIRKMPAWQPGQLDGEPDRFAYRLPVTFRLQ